MLTHYHVPVFIIILLVSIARQTQASGVFELELIKFQPLDVRPTPDDNENSTKIERSNDEDQTNYIRVLVCLKEAFTSHLDGPCTFGNASITLNRGSLHDQEALSHPALSNRIIPQESRQRHSHAHNLTSSQQQQAGSLMTNLVRILFTFRWTKSFTIILTAEESHVDDDKQSATGQASRRQENSGNRTTIELSAANKLTTSKQDQINRSPPYFDRHVLTENEVLPNLDSNPNKPWSSRFSRSLKSSLAYRFRVYCSLNYYGDGCTTFCRARDDQFGHYNCSSTGQKVCLDGWTGSDCERAKCRPGCNHQHGYCDKPDTCQCRPGWTGPRCDECIIYPGCQNGYCLSAWQCICQQNWGGVLCDQDLNYCGTHEPCKNNGTCQNIAPGRYKCNCLDGFTGVDCDLSLNSTAQTNGLHQLTAGCAQNPCLNGGTCYGYNSLDSSMVFGSPTSAEILNPESQQEPGRFYRCQCGPEWTGDYCQWSDMDHTVVDSMPNVQIQLDGLSNTTSVSSHMIDGQSTSIERNESTTEFNVPQYLTPFMESSRQTLPPSHHMDMRHFISGVLIASIIGVFLASLLLAWCCLIAIERNRFSFIQMNIVRGGDGGDQPVVSSTLRRMHEKIRDSFRRSSRSRIKPETKLSIENVLRPPQPPPTYEESNKYGSGKLHLNSSERASADSSKEGCASLSGLKQKNLVIDDNLEERSPSSTSIDGPDLPPINSISDARLTCPRHSHLYRKQPVALSCDGTIYSPNSITHPLNHNDPHRGDYRNYHNH